MFTGQNSAAAIVYPGNQVDAFIEHENMAQAVNFPSYIWNGLPSGSSNYEQGRYEEAEELGAKASKTGTRVLGEEHPDTMTSMGNLATTYFEQRRYKEAEELDVKTLESRRRVLGEEHPDTLTSMSNLATTYREQRRYKEAEELDVLAQYIRGRNSSH
jgi:tetratricopeptide (TPR) repeat protein